MPLLPDDEHDSRLRALVHPDDYANPEPADRYNLVVVGAGTAGLVTAAGAAGMGARVALVEREFMGGDCLNVGCVPSKGIIGAARAAAAVRGAGAFGVRVPEGVEVDFAAAMERMRKLRSDIGHHDSVERFTGLGIDVFLGQGRFVGRDALEVDGKRLNFRKAVIATGARAAAPPIPGLDEVDSLTNETLFTLTERPNRLGVIGAGPIGCEMAQTFAQLGSEVSQVEAQHGIMPRDDPDASEIVRRRMTAEGVTLLCCAQDLALSPAEGGAVNLKVTSHDQAHDLDVDELVVAVGRAPNVEGLDLETAGVDFHDKGVTVDDRLRTTNPNIYAAGDICSPYQFTHAADFMARTVIRNALFLGRAKASDLVIPWCTYTSPEVAHVGLDARRASEQGIEIDTFTQELSGVDRAILDGETEGFVRVHVKKGTDRIVGATVVAAHAGDIIAPLVGAMTHKSGLASLADVIHPYPTQGEALRKVGDLYNRTRLTPRVKSLFEKWLTWTR